MRKLFVFAFMIGILGMILVFSWNVAEAKADNSMKVNERKYFTSYVVEKGDTLWDIAEEFMTEEYESIYCYIEEVMESNHLEHTGIKQGQMLILPYYADAPVSDL